MIHGFFTTRNRFIWFIWCTVGPIISDHYTIIIMIFIWLDIIIISSLYWFFIFCRTMPFRQLDIVWWAEGGTFSFQIQDWRRFSAFQRVFWKKVSVEIAVVLLKQVLTSLQYVYIYNIFFVPPRGRTNMENRHLPHTRFLGMEHPISSMWKRWWFCHKPCVFSILKKGTAPKNGGLFNKLDAIVWIAKSWGFLQRCTGLCVRPETFSSVKSFPIGKNPGGRCCSHHFHLGIELSTDALSAATGAEQWASRW